LCLEEFRRLSIRVLDGSIALRWPTPVPLFDVLDLAPVTQTGAMKQESVRCSGVGQLATHRCELGQEFRPCGRFNRRGLRIAVAGHAVARFSPLIIQL
jgi:hypothetical protein